jgi:putative flippase GtrA
VKGRASTLARDEAVRRFGRFLLVGLGNTAVGYALYAALLLAGMGPQASLALSFAIGVAWNFWTHARLVFGTRGLSRLPRYVGAYLLVWAGNALVLAWLTSAGVPPLAAQALVLPFAAVAAFVLVGLALTGRLPLPGRGQHSPRK